MKTPEQIFEQVTENIYTDEDGRDLALVVAAIEADRAQRSDMERFGRFVYELMEEQPEWSSDTFNDIALYAANVLKRPFSEPSEEG